MKRLNFETLFNQKVDWINTNIEILSEQKEYDTIVPKKFFDMANADVIHAYSLKRKLLDKNLYLSVLTKTERTIIVYIFVYKLTLKEISEEHGVSTHTIDTIYKRSIQKIKESLQC